MDALKNLFHKKEETTQKWDTFLGHAKGKGEVWLYGKNICDNTCWIEPAVLTDDGWLFTSTMQPPTENVTLVAWSEKSYPNL